MAHKTSNDPEVYITPGLAQPAQRALKAAGYTRLEQFASVSEDDLLKLHGVGPKAIETLRQALADQGLAFAEPVYDSPRDFVTPHIREYVESNGQQGYLWRGCPTLLLTTRGRKSGKLRRTALIFGQDGENYLVVGSYGGRPIHPLWYLNLVENPMVEIQVKEKKMKAWARTATPEEKQRLWPVMSKIFPTYDEYLHKARESGREIPLIILEPK
jgi:deazaflavin-dependent oxidoreductase (nitroreductase family)